MTIHTRTPAGVPSSECLRAFFVSAQTPVLGIMKHQVGKVSGMVRLAAQSATSFPCVVQTPTDKVNSVAVIQQKAIGFGIV